MSAAANESLSQKLLLSEQRSERILQLLEHKSQRSNANNSLELMRQAVSPGSLFPLRTRATHTSSEASVTAGASYSSGRRSVANESSRTTSGTVADSMLHRASMALKQSQLESQRKDRLIENLKEQVMSIGEANTRMQGFKAELDIQSRQNALRESELKDRVYTMQASYDAQKQVELDISAALAEQRQQSLRLQKSHAYDTGLLASQLVDMETHQGKMEGVVVQLQADLEALRQSNAEHVQMHAAAAKQAAMLERELATANTEARQQSEDARRGAKALKEALMDKKELVEETVALRARVDELHGELRESRQECVKLQGLQVKVAGMKTEISALTLDQKADHALLSKHDAVTHNLQRQIEMSQQLHQENVASGELQRELEGQAERARAALEVRLRACVCVYGVLALRLVCLCIFICDSPFLFHAGTHQHGAGGRPHCPVQPTNCHQKLQTVAQSARGCAKAVRGGAAAQRGAGAIQP
jgi:hypothetical protein